MRRNTGAIPFDVEGRGFVLPLDLVEIEKFGELSFAVMSEADPLMRKFGNGADPAAVLATWDALPLLHSDRGAILIFRNGSIGLHGP